MIVHDYNYLKLVGIKHMLEVQNDTVCNNIHLMLFEAKLHHYMSSNCVEQASCLSMNVWKQVIEDFAKFDLLLKLKRGSKEEKYKVEVHKNNAGGFHLNQMEQHEGWLHLPSIASQILCGLVYLICVCVYFKCTACQPTKNGIVSKCVWILTYLYGWWCYGLIYFIWRPYILHLVA